MMLIGLGTRKCQMSPLLQEGSCAWNGTPESRFPVRLRTCCPLLVPVCAASWGVRVPHLWQRSIGTSLCTATVPSLGRLRLEVPKPLGAPQHSAWVQHTAPQSPSSWGFLLPLETLRAWETLPQWHFLNWASSMFSAWSKHTKDTLVAFYEFKSSLAVLPCLQTKKERGISFVSSFPGS